MRYVYVKNGDAVAQTRRVLATGRHTGPDAYIGGFLAAHRSDDVLVLCRSRPAERFTADRVVAESYPPSSRGGRFPGRVFAALRAGARMLEWRPHRVVCGCAQEMLWVSVAVAKILGIPIVASRHTGMPGRGGIRRLSYWLEALSLKRCDAVICHGPFLADNVRQAGVPVNHIIEFGVDLSEFATADSGPSSAIPESLASFVTRFPSVVMYVGRMQENKGIIDLLTACSRLRAPGSDRVGLVYVGEGDHADRLRAAVASLRMQDRVLILGRLPHQCLAAVMRCAAVIATPTQPPLQEGRCKVVVEAFTVGVPVVAPDFAAFPYSVNHEENGLLYNAGNVGALADALDRIIADRELSNRLRRGALASGVSLLEAKQHDFVSAVEAAFG